MDRILKPIAEWVLGSAPIVACAGLGKGHQSLILAYHNVVPEGTPSAGDASLHLSFDLFRAQLDRIPSSYRVVSLDQATASEGIDGPAVAITFDDAYAGALGLALPELAAREFPATVFVAPGLLGEPSPWWDAYADGEIDPALRHCWLESERGEEVRIRAAAERTGRARNPERPTLRIASVAELIDASRLPGVTLGAHSWSHPNLARLPAEELAAELTRPLAWLRERVPDRLTPWLAYPYGRTTDGVAAAAVEAGFVGGLLVRGGWSGANENRFAWPRFNIPAGLSPRGFAMRLAGFLASE